MLPVSDASDAEKLAEQLKEFIYIVSHDLSAPLRGVVEFSKLLEMEQRDVLNESGKEYLSLIVESGVKLQNMLAGLLDFSRLNTAPAVFTAVDCNQVLASCKTALKDRIAASQATIEIADLPTITGDRKQLQQLFHALLDNALKFHAQGVAPHLSLSAEKKADSWVFSLRDHGIGIGEAFHQRIFKPFQRLHTDQEYAGIGMGLPLAKKIVETHGGTIQVESVAAQGSCFVVTLPVHPGH